MLKKWRRLGIALSTILLGVCLFAGASVNVQRTDAEDGSETENGTAIGTLGGHTCALFGEALNTNMAMDFGLVNQQAFDELVFMMSQTEIPSGQTTVCRLALAENVSWTALEVPEGLYVGVCKNGFAFDGDDELPVSDTAGVFTYDCTERHTCRELKSELSVLTQGQIDFLPYWMMNGGELGSADAYANGFALSGDVTFSAFWTNQMPGATLTVCCNGYTLEGEEVLGATVNVMNCRTQTGEHTCTALGEDVVAIGLNEVPMTEDNRIVEEIQSGENTTKTIYTKKSDSFSPYADERGVFFGYGTAEAPVSGSYAFALNENISLAKTLKIPAGMDVRICLNGYELLAPAIRLYSGDKEDIMSAFHVQNGASLTICDCSPDASGTLKSNMNDFEAETTGGWDGLGVAITLVFTHTITNEGTVTMESGRIVSMIGIFNLGDVVVNGGSVIGAVSSVVQGLDENLDETDGAPSTVVNGGTVSGALAGLYGTNGDVTVNGGEIKSLSTGISLGATLDGEPTGDVGDLTINGGEIVFDVEMLEVLMNEYGEFIEEINVEDLTLVDTVAVLTNGTVNLNADVNVSYTEDFLALQEYSAELDTAKRQEEADALLGEGEESVPVEPTVYTATDFGLKGGGIIKTKEGYTYQNEYTVMADSGQTIVDDPISGAFTVPDGYLMVYDTDGQAIIVENTENIVYPVKVAGATVSTDGTIKMNFYVTVDENLDLAQAGVVMIHKGEQTEYTFSEDRKNGNFYVFSADVCAKDYQEPIVCRIYAPVEYNDTQITVGWDGANVTLEHYLDLMIADTTGTYDDAKMLCRAMKNYCMSAGALFGTTTDYVPIAELKEGLDMVTTEALSPLAMTYFGASDKVTLSGVTLLLESTTAIRIYFTLKEGVTVDQVKVFIDDAETNFAPASGTKNMYYVEVSNIAATNLAKTYAIKIDGYTVNYSALSYAYTVLVSPTSDAKSVAVVKAMCVYCVIANEYFNAE